MSDNVVIDREAWEQHAAWWDGEAQRVRQQYAVDDATLAHAGSMFGKIGEKTVGAGLQDVLRARHDFGQRLGAYCDGVAAHIRHNLEQYSDTRGSEPPRPERIGPPWRPPVCTLIR